MLLSGKADLVWKETWQPICSRVPPEGGWVWPDIRTRYRKKPKNLSVGFWCENSEILCGMMASRLNNTACVLDRLEGYPGDNSPFKGYIALMAIELCAAYAAITGRREVWLNEPANEGLIRYYQSLGFEYVAAVNSNSAFCRKEV